MLFHFTFFSLSVSTHIPNMFIRFGISSMTKGIFFSVVALHITMLCFFSAMQQRWKTHCGHLEVLERSLKYTPVRKNNQTKGEKRKTNLWCSLMAISGHLLYGFSRVSISFFESIFQLNTALLNARPAKSNHTFIHQGNEKYIKKSSSTISWKPTTPYKSKILQ